MEVLTTCTLTVTLLASVFFMVSTATNYWSNDDLKWGNVHGGIFTVCLNAERKSLCVTTDLEKFRKLPVWSQAIVVSVLIADCALASALLSFIIQALCHKTNIMTVQAFGLLAAISMTIGLSIFTQKLIQVKKGKITFGWSYFLGWVGVILLLIGHTSIFIVKFVRFRREPAEDMVPLPVV